MSHTIYRSLRTFLAVLAVVAALPVASAAQPSAVASFTGVPPQSFIGEPVTFTVSFDNASPAAAGYGPYLDLVLPAIGADGAGGAIDDGITFVAATYLGSPVTATVLTFDTLGNATHPYARAAGGAPIIVTGTPGNQLVVLQLPFGSFTASQPPVNVLVTTALSNLADVTAPLTLQARGGFQYGADPLDNPASDPSIIGSYANAPTTPTVLRLRKTYVGPEDETATGPNFPRQYLIEVDIADGQTLTDLDLTDLLPATLQYVSVDATTIRGTPTATTSISTPITTTPGGTLTRRFASVTGTTATNDATLLFTCYVPRVSAVAAAIIDAASGDDAQSIDDARAQGTWDPIDGRDAAGPAITDVTTNDHVLTDKSIAIQKSVAIVNDIGATGASPGDVLQYTLSAQVSDFFAFQNLIVTDVLGDGLRPDMTFVPTLAVTEHGNMSSGVMLAGNVDFVHNSPGAGTTTSTFSVSDELVTRTLDGVLPGGCVPVGGTGGPPPDCTSFNGGGTTITLVYRAIIQTDYTDTFPSTDPSVDEGDVLGNDVTVAGDVLSAASLAASGQSEADDSHAEVIIRQGELFKTVYAVNGSTTLPSPIRIGPGDTITYRLTLTLPTSNIEPLTVTDYLPLPIFSATTVTTFDPTVDAAAPPAGQAKFGPGDTFFALSNITPTLSSNGTSNSLAFDYVQFDSQASPSTTIDLLFTVTASDQPFADGLFLTNQANAAQSTTQLQASTRDAIVQIQITEPDVRVTKGVVATDAPSGVFSPTTVGPVAFSAPGSAGYRGTGTIHSTNLTTSPIDSNLTGLDAGDLVTFAIVLENRGNGVNGAFDVRVRDALPAGLTVPASGAGLNLHVTDGTGAALPFTTIGGGLFDLAGGIELTDGANGALGPNDPTNALNLAIITFDLEVTGAASPAQQITNTATLFSFAGTEGGPDFTSTDRTDVATVTVASPAVTKTIVTTNQAHTSANNVAIGEQVQYQVVVRVPEGAADTVTLVDTLPLGLAIVSLDSLTPSSGALTSTAGTFGSILASGVVSNVGAGAQNAGRRVTFDLGTLTNSDRDDAAAETITLLLTAVVINGGSNDRGDTRTNAAVWSFTGGSASGSSPAVTIVEPTLQVVKSALPAVGDAGDTITFSVTLSHATGSNATAFEATLADVVPAGVTFVSATHSAGLAPTVLTPGGGFTASWTTFPVGATSTIALAVTLDANVTSGQVITNTGTSAWTSLPGVQTITQSSFNTLATERTGSAADPGGADNDHTASGQATVTALAPVPTKSIISTNLPATAGNAVAIGEQVQYQVQVAIPEGANTNVTLVDTLDPGLAFLSFDGLTSSSPSVSTNVGGGFPAVLAGRSVSNVGGGTANDGRRVTFSLGTVTNVDNDNGTTETLTFTYTVVVINAAANVRGSLRNNSAVWSSDGSSVSSAAPDVTIVEPTLQIVKGAAPATGDAGGTITFTLTVSHTGASNATAYDVTLADVVPAGLTYVPASAAHTGGVAPTSLSFATGTVTATYASLSTGQTSVIQFQATLDNSPPVTPGDLITNTATLLWSGLPGTVTTPQSSLNTLSTERTGLSTDPGGVANTYSANDSEGVTVNESDLAGFVYVDTNGDGQRAGDPGIVGVTVRLTGTDHLGNAVLLITTTLANGSYTFTGLRPGTYTITEMQPSGYADGLDTVGTPALGATVGNDVLGVITIPAGSSTSGTEFNFGELSSADLSVTKTDTPDPVLPGGTLVYTVDVTNAGPNIAANAVLTDPLPGGTTFVSLLAPGGWSCTTPVVGAAGTVSCTHAAFPVGAASFTLTVQVDAGVAAHSTLRNVATITSSARDINPTNNQDDEPTLVAASGDADLEVTKTDSPDPASVGQTVTYTLTVRNNGPATTDATVTDTLPAALALVSATPSSGTCSAVNPVMCSIPGMAPGSTQTITIQATALVSGVATNTVSVTGTQPDPNPANDQASEPTTIVGPGETDLRISKTGPLTVARGSHLTYTLVVTNNGPIAAATVLVDDPLALPGLTFVSNGGDCATAFPCALGTIAAGDTRTIVSTYAVGGSYAGANPIVNTATVSSATPESNTENNTTEARTLVADGAAADLTVTKVDSPDATVAGMPIAYTLVVTNHGPGTATGATVTDTLPAGVTLVSSTSSQGSCIGTVTVVCSLGTLTNGANATVAIVVQSNSALPTPNPIVNTATVSSTSTDPDPSNDSTTQPTTIVAQTDLQITKGAPVSTTAGSPLVFTIVVTNAGPSDAANVVVADPTPAGLVFTSNSGDCTTAFPCALGTVPAGATRTITATFAVPSSYLTPNPIANTATVSSSTAETNATNNSASSSTTLALDADLAITKNGPATISAGHTITYTLVVTNNGPSDAATVQVSDATPANLTFVGNTGDCTTAFPCGFAALATGETRTIVSTFLVPSNYAAPNPIGNTATVSSATPDTQPANNSATATTTLGAPSADVSVTKIGPATAIPGNPISYTITVTNNGPADAAGVALADPTPSGLSFVSNTGACLTAFPCSLGVVAAGETRIITTTFLVPSGYTTPDPISNTATVSSSTADSNPANNSATALTSVGADLSLTKAAAPEPVAAGALLTFTIVSTNGGARDASDLVITDSVPVGTAFVSAATSTGGACLTPAVGATTGPVTCTWAGATPQGTTRTLTLVVRVDAGAAPGSTVVNTATTSSSTNDPHPASNTASTTSSVVTAADLVLTKTVDRPTPNVTDTVLFTITVRNAGPSYATGVAVVDAIPAGLTLISATPSVGPYDAPTGLWTVGALAVNATATLSVQARVDASGGLTNTATVTTSDQFDPDTSNNTAGAAINTPAAVDLQVQKTVNRLEASVGTEVTFTITVRNAGPDSATGVVLSDVLPAGLSFISATPSTGAYEAGSGAWTIGSLALNATATLTITARLVGEDIITNIAHVSGRDQYDTAPGNDAAGISVNGLAADLQVVKTVDRSTPNAGERVAFTIAVTNNGPGEATAVRVSDALSSAFGFVSATPSQGLYVPETGLWSVGTLAAPGTGGVSSATLQIVATAFEPDEAVNTARVAGGDQPDPNPANDTSSVSLDGGAIDLGAGLTFTGDANGVGRLFDFFVDVTNRSSYEAREPLVVAIPFPAELAFNAPQTTWPCEAVGRTLFCEHELDTPLTPDRSQKLAYWADVLRTFPRGLAAYAHVASAQDPNVANNVGAVLLTPPAPAAADLQVTQTMSSTQGSSGLTVTYRAEVTNLGAGTASDVTLVDVLPDSLTLVSIVSEVGNCAGTRRLACSLGTLAPQQRAIVTITAQATAAALVGHTVSVSGREPDPNLANNAARTALRSSAVSNPARDSDGDGLPDVWESQMGLNPGSTDAALDADNDGLSNAQEYAQHSHPRGFHRQFFAEGAANQLFGTMFSLVNPSPTRDASVAVEVMKDSGEVMMAPLQLGAMRRTDLSGRDLLAPWQGAFSTLIESDQPIAADRLTWWDATGYGTALEAGLPAPSTRWLFAEGATHGFQLFFLLQNPDATQAAEVTIRYLLPSGPPLVRTYQIAAHSRLTILVNEIPELSATDLSAEVLSTRPIVAERAMYRNTTSQLMAAGHVAAGASAPAATWLFAEGATGDFLNLYLLVANPNASAASVDVRYLLPDGQTIVRTHVVSGNTRRTIDVASEDPRLAATSVGMTVSASLPIVAERAMWWPGPRFAASWYESHVVLGATAAGTRWAVASGAAGGAAGDQTFVLIANQAPAAGRVRVTAILDDGGSYVREMPIAETARMTLEIGALFPEAANHAFSVIVESIGASPVPIVVEGSRYASPGGQLWGAGSAALATRLQ